MPWYYVDGEEVWCADKDKVAQYAKEQGVSEDRIVVVAEQEEFISARDEYSRNNSNGRLW